jgi:ADP-heptose:LPS heptosyltransferase
VTVLKPLERSLRRFFLAATDRPFAGDFVTGPRAALALPPAPRILLLRQDRIGDVLVSLPVIRALRAAYPDARLDMLFSRTNYGVRGAVLPYLDRAWRYDKTPAGAVRLLRALRRARYDVVVDLMDNPSTNAQLVARWCGAPRRVGIRHERAGHYTHAVPLLDRERVHIVERVAQLLLPFGIDPGAVPLELEYQLDPAERRRARALLGPRTRPLLLAVNISPRYWGRDNFIRVIRWVAESDPRFGVMVGGAPTPAQQTEVAAIARATGARVIPPVPSFQEYAAVIREADLLLTPDTSVLHLGPAWRIPTVGLFHRPPGAPLPWYPYRSPHRAVVHPAGVVHIPLAAVQDAVRSLVAERFPEGGEVGAATP